jgi:hypothetical protein
LIKAVNKSNKRGQSGNPSIGNTPLKANKSVSNSLSPQKGRPLVSKQKRVTPNEKMSAFKGE